MVLNTTSSTITIKLVVSNCDEGMPTYRVTARSMSSGVVTTALNITSTVYLITSLEADTAYDVEVVDIECLNVILNRLSVMTNMDSSKLCNCVCLFCTLSYELLSNTWLLAFLVHISLTFEVFLYDCLLCLEDKNRL